MSFLLAFKPNHNVSVKQPLILFLTHVTVVSVMFSILVQRLQNVQSGNVSSGCGRRLLRRAESPFSSTMRWKTHFLKPRLLSLKQEGASSGLWEGFSTDPPNKDPSKSNKCWNTSKRTKSFALWNNPNRLFTKKFWHFTLII